MANKYSVECGLVETLLLQSDYSPGVVQLVSEQLSTYLGRMEAKAVSARKDGRIAAFGKADKDAAGDLKFLPLKVAKADLSYLPCRLLVIADATAVFSKTTGIPVDEIAYTLPESVRGILAGMEAAGKARQAEIDAKRKEQEAKNAAMKERQELAARLLAEHDAQEEKRKAGAAKAAPVTA